jgi:hypothetical protein
MKVSQLLDGWIAWEQEHGHRPDFGALNGHDIPSITGDDQCFYPNGACFARDTLGLSEWRRDDGVPIGCVHFGMGNTP